MHGWWECTLISWCSHYGKQYGGSSQQEHFAGAASSKSVNCGVLGPESQVMLRVAGEPSCACSVHLLGQSTVEDDNLHFSTDKRKKEKETGSFPSRIL